MPGLTELCTRLGLPADIPWDPLWSAAPDFLARIADHVLASKPERIVECSSGATTLILARACMLNGRGRVFSLENGPDFAAATRSALTQHGLEKYAAVIDAPLTDYRLGEEDYRWYALDGLPADRIDMLAVDGPPGFIQHRSRYPALPLLHDRLAPDCTVFLDDAARPDEREIVRRWQAVFPDFSQDYLDLERGCAILRRHGGQSEEAL